MNILHIIPSADPTSGGPIEFVTRLGEQLRGKGHSVHLVSLDDPSADEGTLGFASVTRLGRGIGNYRLNFRLIGWLYRHAPQFDAIVVDGLWQFHGASALMALGWRGIGYHVFSHGMLDPWFKQKYPLKHVKKIFYWLVIERHLLKRATSVIFTCETERTLARQSFPFYSVNESICTLGTAPAPLTVGSTEDNGQRARKRIVFLSRIHEKKGCDALIEAFASLDAVRAEYELVLAGPGEESLVRRLKEQVRSLGIDGDVTWLGMVSGADKWALLRSADVFCLPSHQENFGIAVIEALACGVPVLITKKVNIWHEIVSSGAAFAEDDTVDGVKRLLQQWVALPATKRELMKSAALRCFDEKFNIEQASANYLAALQVAAR